MNETEWIGKCFTFDQIFVFLLFSFLHSNSVAENDFCRGKRLHVFHSSFRDERRDVTYGSSGNADRRLIGDRYRSESNGIGMTNGFALAKSFHMLLWSWELRCKVPIMERFIRSLMGWCSYLMGLWFYNWITVLWAFRCRDGWVHFISNVCLRTCFKRLHLILGKSCNQIIALHFEILPLGQVTVTNLLLAKYSSVNILRWIR